MKLFGLCQEGSLLGEILRQGVFEADPACHVQALTAKIAPAADLPNHELLLLPFDFASSETGAAFLSARCAAAGERIRDRFGEPRAGQTIVIAGEDDDGDALDRFVAAQALTRAPQTRILGVAFASKPRAVAQSATTLKQVLHYYADQPALTGQMLRI